MTQEIQRVHFDSTQEYLIRYGPTSLLDDYLEVLAKLLKTHFVYYGLRTRAALGIMHVKEGHDLTHVIRSQYQKYLEMASHLDITQPTPVCQGELEAQGIAGDIALQTLHDVIALIPKMVAKLEQLTNDAFEMLGMLQGNTTEGDITMACNYSAFLLRARNWRKLLIELDQRLERSKRPPIPLYSWL